MLHQRDTRVEFCNKPNVEGVYNCSGGTSDRYETRDYEQSWLQLVQFDTDSVQEFFMGGSANITIVQTLP